MTSFNPAATPTPAASEPVTATPATPAAPTEPVIEYGGKRLTSADVLKKLENADAFIEQLKAERAQDRDLLTQATEALKKSVSAAELLRATPAPAAPTPTAPVNIADEVNKVVVAREQKATEETNWKAAQEAMTKAFGDQADAKAKAAAAEAGLSFDELVVLARTKPLAFKRIFPELSAAPTPQGRATPSSGGVNQQSLKATPPASSGFWQATKSADQTRIYLERLKQLSGA